MDFGWPNTEFGWKMANGRLLFLALYYMYIHTQHCHTPTHVRVHTHMHTHTHARTRTHILGKTGNLSKSFITRVIYFY